MHRRISIRRHSDHGCRCSCSFCFLCSFFLKQTTTSSQPVSGSREECGERTNGISPAPAPAPAALSSVSMITSSSDRTTKLKPVNLRKNGLDRYSCLKMSHVHDRYILCLSQGPPLTCQHHEKQEQKLLKHFIKLNFK